jgi:hypothetical protein
MNIGPSEEKRKPSFLSCETRKTFKLLNKENVICIRNKNQINDFHFYLENSTKFAKRKESPLFCPPHHVYVCGCVREDGKIRKHLVGIEYKKVRITAFFYYYYS